MKISAVIITFNEERNIGRCLDSVKDVADEIILLDSYSTDNTVQIAKNKGAKIYSQTFLGYIEQKNKALELTSNPWVLSLDADEVLDDTLRCAIVNVKKQMPTSGAYTMNRCTNYCGRFIRHGSWYPDKKLRLFNKTEGHWGGDNPHDKVIIPPGIPVFHLKGDILHYSYNSIADHIEQNNRFSSISAATMLQKRKRTSLAKIVINPLWAFIVSYIIRSGFLDGFYGIVIAINIAHLTFLKHVKLYQIQKKKAV